MRLGVLTRSAVVPVPICPLVFCPQPQTVPSALTAKLE